MGANQNRECNKNLIENIKKSNSGPGSAAEKTENEQIFLTNEKNKTKNKFFSTEQSYLPPVLIGVRYNGPQLTERTI